MLTFYKMLTTAKFCFDAPTDISLMSAFAATARGKTTPIY